MESLIQIDFGQIASDFRSAMAATLPESTIRSISDQLKALSPTAAGIYRATGTIRSGQLLTGCEITINDGETFKGQAAGPLTAPPTLTGDVYTLNISRLYKETSSAALVATTEQSGFVFTDKEGNVLGAFRAGGFQSQVSAIFLGVWS